MFVVVTVFGLIHQRVAIKKPDQCREPTYDNPQMNPLLMSDDIHLKACEGRNSDKYLLDGVYEDRKNLWRNKNVRRAFVTVPVTSYPPDSMDVARALYSPGEGCKTTNKNCKTYRDLRFNR
jgi:hypothetical protein